MTHDVPSDAPLQAWELRVDGRSHRVEVRGSVARRIQWWVEGELVLDKRSADDKPRLTPDERSELGTLALRFSGLGKPRRATVVRPGELMGVDLDPEPGSPAAAYEEHVRAHPRRYEVLQTAGSVAAVVVPILVTLLLARLAFSINWPWPDWDLPRLPLPDLPEIPWPSIPWPDLPGVSLPGWVREVLDKAKYVWPVVLAYVLAKAEINRRRKQDALRAELRTRREEREGDEI